MKSIQTMNPSVYEPVKSNVFTVRMLAILLPLILTLGACGENKKQDRPNVILIMADDMGFECLGSYGGLSYKTPVLDRLAAQGIRFANCVSQPLCTPSRVKIMTGLYNYRNYEYFGYLNLNQSTFGKLMKDAGYTTCIAGKWQLNGLAYKNKIADWNDITRPNQFGFDEYCLWQLTKERREGERYANPLIEQNGKVLPRDENAYGPDIFSNFVLNFIDKNRDKPFFIYYPMVLVHEPFVPTPDSRTWDDPSLRYKNDTSYFRDMVVYTDKIVGKIWDKLKAKGLEKNTILIFTGDNGTHPSIFSKTKMRMVRGDKGNTTDGGTHVPLIVYWPDKIKKGAVFENLIEFSDFYPTLAALTGQQVQVDGKSFFPLLTGGTYQSRQTAFVYYDPRWGKRVNRYRGEFIRTLGFKLYRDGRFFNLREDILEQNPLISDSLSQKAAMIRGMLEKDLKKHPPLRKND